MSGVLAGISLIAASVSAGGRGTPLAFTNFDEPLSGGQYYDFGNADADHQLVNNDGHAMVAWEASGPEMGFTAWYYTTGGVGLTDGDSVGVIASPGARTAGQRGTGQSYKISDPDGIMQVVFDTVTNPAGDDWSISLDLQVGWTGWETTDTIIVDIVVDGNEVLPLFDTIGQDIDDLGIEGEWFPLLRGLNGYTEATLRVSLEANAASEAIYIDNIVFGFGSIPDADGDGIPDATDNCDLPNADQLDCNGNGVGDVCDLAYGTSSDCNANNSPDECDIASGSEQDCNQNGLPDTCDINGGTSPDWNGDGIPDECQPCIADISDDGIVDVTDLLAVIAAWGLCGEEGMRGPSTSVLDRHRSNDLRVMTWNIEHAGGGSLEFLPASGSAAELAPFIRVLSAIDADVILFNEMDDDGEVAGLSTWLSEHVRGGSWQVHQGIGSGDRSVMASYFPLSMKATNTTPPITPPTWSGRGVTMALVDCPDSTWSTDLYLLGVHLKAGGETDDELQRQESADGIAHWLGDLRTAGEEVDLPLNTPMVVFGDLNFYSEGTQPELTILTGDIQNEAYYGPDIKGDWDESDLEDVMPVDPMTGDLWTIWNYKSRIDRFMVTDSVSETGNTFILNTMTLTQEELDANGLEASDTHDTVTSDHLPVVVDFRDPAHCTADLNNDGVIDVSDLLIVIGNWGACS